VTSQVRERLERGAVTVSIRVERAGAAPAVRIDRAVAVHAHGELASLAAALGLAPPTLADLLALPGVVATAAGDDAASELGEAGDQAAAGGAAARAALDALVAMRTTEGAALGRDLADRVASLVATIDQVAAAGERSAAAALDRLRERVARLCEPELAATIDPARLAQEVAILADRADVTEELVRARAHLAQLAAATAAQGPIGRRLDFLTQELGRELNTLGAKSTAPAIGPLVVDAKAQLEKIREQVQNLE
jgi:uncharacterized protein (TIGR00255 family)